MKIIARHFATAALAVSAAGLSGCIEDPGFKYESSGKERSSASVSDIAAEAILKDEIRFEREMARQEEAESRKAKLELERLVAQEKHSQDFENDVYRSAFADTKGPSSTSWDSPSVKTTVSPSDTASKAEPASSNPVMATN